MPDEAVLPDLSRFDRVSFDTETTGLTRADRPTGMGLATPDGTQWYFSWGAGDRSGLDGPPEMNNISLPRFREWANAELTKKGTVRAAHNAAFDCRMLAYVGVLPTGVEDTMVLAPLLNEHRPSFKLDSMCKAEGLGGKDDTMLHMWMARNIRGADGKFLKPGRKECAGYYWKVPSYIIESYGGTDAALTLKLYDKYRPMIDTEGLSAVYATETALIPVLLRMHLAGVRVDRDRAYELAKEMTIELGHLGAQWRTEFCDGEEVGIRSPSELGPLLDRLGIEYPLTEKTKKPSITKDFLEGLLHPLGAHLRRMRTLEHYRDHFVQGDVLGDTSDEYDILHPEFHALKSDEYGTIGGRLSSGGEGGNMQNKPSRDEEWAPRIRSMYRPHRDDQIWWRGDYSQIEYRLFAHYAGLYARSRGQQSAMEQAYIDNPLIDFHQWVADVAGIGRKPAKNTNFCRLYGGGVAKIALTAGVTLQEAEEFVRAYDEKIPEAQDVSNWIKGAANKRGYVWNFGGRKLRFQTEESRAEKWGGTVKPGRAHRYLMTHAALNRVLQGGSADFTKRAMIEVDKNIDYERTIMSLSVHDELDGSTNRDGAHEEIAKIRTIMQDVSREPMFNGDRMRVPVIVEMESGENWGMYAAA